MAARLVGATQIFVVPEGALHLVNLAALPADDPRYLIETGPLIHYLSAERDLVRGEDLQAPGAGLLAVGGPAFDDATALTDPVATRLATHSRAPAASSRHASASLTTPARDEAAAPATGSAGRYRGPRSGCGDFRSLRFEALPEAAREASEIVRLWRQQKSAPQREAAELRGTAANEAAFKARAAGHRALHLATHGFFLGDRCPSALEGSSVVRSAQKAAIRPPAAMAENPLLLSGLALAGANRREASGPDDEDGILTAEEIASLDLRGVEWAVLSACNTGAGEVRAGEGVLGLRRAFQVAGVRTTIMSLWSVDDRAARRWMQTLYEERLHSGLGTAEAARAASLRELRARRARGQSTHPFYWGAFVAAGDWK